MAYKTAEDLAEPSMSIIISAGDGRKVAFDAIEALAAADYAKAGALLEVAQNNFRDAHRVHTECIQAAASEEFPYSVLFTHAEDTLMTAEAQFRLIKKLLPVFENLDRRLAAVEAAVAAGGN